MGIERDTSLLADFLARGVLAEDVPGLHALLAGAGIAEEIQRSLG